MTVLLTSVAAMSILPSLPHSGTHSLQRTANVISNHFILLGRLECRFQRRSCPNIGYSLCCVPLFLSHPSCENSLRLLVNGLFPIYIATLGTKGVNAERLQLLKIPNRPRQSSTKYSPVLKFLGLRPIQL